jgi:hypothetical protein
MSAISGAAVKILINGVAVGRATGVSATENIEQLPVSVLGDIDVVEYEAVSRTVSVTADFVRIRLNSLQEQNVFPRGETADVINFPEMTWLVYDGVNDVVIWTLEGVCPESRTWRVDQGSIMTVNGSFRARRMHDEQAS